MARKFPQVSNLVAAHIISKSTLIHLTTMVEDCSGIDSSIAEVADMISKENIARYIDTQDEDARHGNDLPVGGMWLNSSLVSCDENDWELICEYAAEIVAFELNQTFRISFGDK